jgi:hypothetical protein
MVVLRNKKYKYKICMGIGGMTQVVAESLSLVPSITKKLWNHKRPWKAKTI